MEEHSFQKNLALFEHAIKAEGARRYLTKIVLLIIVYIITAKLGLWLASDIDQVTTIWPPTGIAIVATLIWGYHYAPGIFLGALLANVLTSVSIPVAAGIATGNMLEAVTAAYLIQRFIDRHSILEKIGSILRFVALGAFAAAVISASIGVLSLLLGGLIDSGQAGNTWLIWWVGDVMGASLIVPFVLAWRMRTYRSVIIDNLFETIFILTIVGTAAAIVFSQPDRSAPITSMMIYLLFPLVIWASVRLTQIGAVTASAVIAIAAIWGTLVGRGPYTLTDSVEQNLLLVHLFTFVIIVTGLTLAVAVSGRLQTEHELRRQAEELKEAKQKILQSVKWRRDAENEMRDATNRINEILGGIFEEKTKNR